MKHHKCLAYEHNPFLATFEDSDLTIMHTNYLKVIWSFFLKKIFKDAQMLIWSLLGHYDILGFLRGVCEIY